MRRRGLLTGPLVGLALALLLWTQAAEAAEEIVLGSAISQTGKYATYLGL